MTMRSRRVSRAFQTSPILPARRRRGAGRSEFIAWRLGARYPYPSRSMIGVPLLTHLACGKLPSTKPASLTLSDSAVLIGLDGSAPRRERFQIGVRRSVEELGKPGFHRDVRPLHPRAGGPATSTGQSYGASFTNASVPEVATACRCDNSPVLPDR